MYYIGLDIGGTKCASTLGKIKNDNIEIIDKDYFLTANQNPYDILAKFSVFIEKHLDKKLQGIGISCGGPLDSKKGIIMAPPSLPLVLILIQKLRKKILLMEYIQMILVMKKYRIIYVNG